MQEVEQLSLADFIARENVTMKCREVDTRPDDLMQESATHWRCVLNAGRTMPHFAGQSMNVERVGDKPCKMVIYFSQGSAHTGPPTLADVLDCCASDYTTGTFNDFCSDFGYDSDSRAAEKVYRACVSQSRRLRHLFGETEDYCPVTEDLIYNTERL